MTDYQSLYAAKLTTAEELARRVENGWVLGMDVSASQTPAIVDALTDRARVDELKDVWVHTNLEVYPYAFYTDDSLKGKVNGMSWFSGAAARQAVNAGYADFKPHYYRDTMRDIRDGYTFDAFCVEVSPMDKHGYFSLGTINSYAGTMMEKSRRIFVEVNRHQPRAVCGLQVHVSQVDAIVEYDHPLPVIRKPDMDETSLTIGHLIAEQIPDGACIQLGIGAIPDAVGLALKAKHDLGIHTEMFTDSMVELLDCGAVNNSKKQIHRGQTVTTFAYGSQRIYDYIDDNPGILLLPVDYVNDPAVIARNDNMISINAALEVDLMGQVCAESMGTRHISGSGGQVDFVRGACQSRGGKSFIAFHSTAKDGTVSRIQSVLTPGAVVTTSKNDVDHVVTEYGIAHLRGRPLSERARQLIAIAHPDHRDRLRFEAKKRGIMI